MRAGSRGLGGGHRFLGERRSVVPPKRSAQGSVRVSGGLRAGVTRNCLSLDTNFSNLRSGWWGAGGATGWHSPLVTPITRSVAMGQGPG